MSGPSIFAINELIPHSDNPSVYAIYKMSCGHLIPPLCNHIINEGKSHDTPTH